MTYRPRATFTTPQLLEITGLTRRQLQRLEDAGALTPFRRGAKGRGYHAKWSVEQTIAAGYAKVLADAGCDVAWVWAACKWVASRRPRELGEAFGEGRVLLVLEPGGEGRLVEPEVAPTREQRLRAAWLDLRRTHDRVLRRAEELVDREIGKARGRLRELAGAVGAGKG